MADLPFDASDASSVDGWFAGLTQSLEELLGAQGAQSVLARALEDARRTWPQLSRVVFKHGGLDLSPLCSSYPSPLGDGCSLEASVALRGLVDSLKILLECLLGWELTAGLVAWEGGSPEDSDEREEDSPFSGCA